MKDRPELYELGYEVTDAMVPNAVLEAVLTAVVFALMRDVVQHYEPDVVVTTYPHYQAPLSAVFTVDEQRGGVQSLIGSTPICTT